MGITLFTDNAASVISDADEFYPGWDTTDLQRMEIFSYSGIGGNMMPGEEKSVAVADPQFVSGPWVEFTNYGSDVPHLQLGMTDTSLQTWLVLVDPNNSNLNRMIMSSYKGSNSTDHPGLSIAIDANGRLVLLVGRYNTTSGVYGAQFVPLSQFDYTKPFLVAITCNDRTYTIKNLTSGLSNSYTLLASEERSYGPEIYLGKPPYSWYGDQNGKTRIAAYAVFNRVLSDTELGDFRAYLLKCIQAKYPSVIF